MRPGKRLPSEHHFSRSFGQRTLMPTSESLVLGRFAKLARVETQRIIISRSSAAEERHSLSRISEGTPSVLSTRTLQENLLVLVVHLATSLLQQKCTLRKRSDGLNKCRTQRMTDRQRNSPVD